jgi:hypothetical protein
VRENQSLRSINQRPGANRQLPVASFQSNSQAIIGNLLENFSFSMRDNHRLFIVKQAAMTDDKSEEKLP